jgi:hypothetical protein
MTEYGIDVSSYQSGISFSQVKSEGFSFTVIKATEGDNYVNPYYAAQTQASLDAGLYTMSYHFVHSADENGQVAEVENNVRKDLPLWLDSEVDGSGEYAVSVDLVGHLRANGWNVAGTYLPRWFWSQIGSPDLTPLGLLWSSGYPGGSGAASTIYNSIGGDGASGWGAYGNVTPTLYQFTNQAHVAGLNVDCSAFRGTLQNLKDATSMALTQADADLVVNNLLNRNIDRQGGQTGTTNLFAYLAWADANAINGRNDVKSSLGSKIDSVAAPQNQQLQTIVTHTNPPVQATATVDPTLLQNAVTAAVNQALTNIAPVVAQAVQAALDAERDAQLHALGYTRTP